MDFNITRKKTGLDRGYSFSEGDMARETGREGEKDPGVRSRLPRPHATLLPTWCLRGESDLYIKDLTQLRGKQFYY